MGKKSEASFATREEWLTEAARNIAIDFAPEFEEFFEDGLEHLAHLKVSTGFPSVRGVNGKVIGECWTDKAALDAKSHHIFISPLLTDPVEVIATLAHEMVHAADNGKHHHRGVFIKCVKAIGLEGKPTATHAGETFKAYAQTLVREALGTYPHTGLKPLFKEKKQSTRMLKVECPACGCIVRMTRKWLDEAGAPFCGTRSHIVDGKPTDKRFRMVPEGLEDEE